MLFRRAVFLRYLHPEIIGRAQGAGVSFRVIDYPLDRSDVIDRGELSSEVPRKKRPVKLHRAHDRSEVNEQRCPLTLAPVAEQPRAPERPG